ncbi:MAG: AAA family ATPase [Deltaproteobacteria bacterium]|nr:MAG: AAA family ATPase [Deltaproteobacteria bacterium]
MILGSSPALRVGLADARREALTMASGLLHGESVKGKDLIARLLHEYSRGVGSFLSVNCAARPKAILESVLFGHRRGAFTGATEASSGLVVAADGGTLFLDEVGELPASVQAKLLRVLQERTVLAVGEHRERRVDLRVVAASHRDLRQLVAEGRFREDLYHRLARFEIHLPPLRERGRDVIVIARAMLNAGMDGVAPRRLSRSAEPVLLAHTWPGNVRELGNVLFRVALKARDGSVSAGDLATALGREHVEPAAPVSQRVIDLVRGSGEASSTELAEALAVPRSTMKRLLRCLVEAGDLATTGEGKATRYRVPVVGSEDADDAREAAALAVVERDGRVTRQVLAEAAGVSTRTAGRVLADLVARGVLEHDGRRGNSAGYVRAAALAG